VKILVNLQLARRGVLYTTSVVLQLILVRVPLKKWAIFGGDLVCSVANSIADAANELSVRWRWHDHEEQASVFFGPFVKKLGRRRRSMASPLLLLRYGFILLIGQSDLNTLDTPCRDGT
jgi:hypothetical protein